MLKIVKLILFPLSIKQQRSIFLTQNLNEAKRILSEKYKKKNEKINECLVKIIERYKINPLHSFLMMLTQAPILFSLYFSISNLSTTVGSIIIPWVLNVNSPDVWHISPIVASILQALVVFTAKEKNVIMIALPIAFGLVFLWKAPVGLSVYWASNAIFSLIEKIIFNSRYIRQRYLNVPSTKEMLESIG